MTSNLEANPNRKLHGKLMAKKSKPMVKGIMEYFATDVDI